MLWSKEGHRHKLWQVTPGSDDDGFAALESCGVIYDTLHYQLEGCLSQTLRSICQYLLISPIATIGKRL